MTRIRIARIRARERARFGRVNEAFLAWAAQYDVGPREGRSRAKHEAWLAARTHVLRLDGGIPTHAQVAAVRARLGASRWPVLSPIAGARARTIGAMRPAVFVILAACSGGSDATPGDASTGTDEDGAVTIDALAAGTAGCGKPSTVAAETWVMRQAMGRPYFIRIPAGYDPTRPYQIVYQQHGCSSSANRETNNVPLEGQSGANAILVRGRAAADCWDTNANGVDIPYWDAMVADVEATWCVDAARRFATGYSSGSFMTHRLACLRGDMLRGIATIAGGQAEGACKGPIGALLIHDLNDNTVNISASIAARDSHRTRNGCGTTTTPTAMAPCVAYDGCGKPVVWCQTTGKDHSRQDALAAPIFWDFLSKL